MGEERERGKWGINGEKVPWLRVLLIDSNSIMNNFVPVGGGKTVLNNVVNHSV